MNVTAWKEHLEKGLGEGAFPCYACAVGKGNDVYFHQIGGNRAVFPEKLPLTEDSLFDMASLSKLMGTTMAALTMMEEGNLRLDARVGDYFDDCHGKEQITIFQLMTHTSGISAHLPLWKMGIEPASAAEAILSSSLVAKTGEKVIYSCMGYILLGKILEKIEEKELDAICRERVFVPLGMKDTGFCPPSDRIFAVTEKKEGRQDYICGHVHDENAHFLGGVSGNAGVFSTLDDSIKFASMLSRHGEGYLRRETFENAIFDHTAHLQDLSRGLGFQLYREGVYPGGEKMAKGSFGHTGFTGTSIFVDKETDVWCVLLANRVHFGRNTPRFFDYRQGLHNLIYGEMRRERA